MRIDVERQVSQGKDAVRFKTSMIYSHSSATIRHFQQVTNNYKAEDGPAKLSELHLWILILEKVSRKSVGSFISLNGSSDPLKWFKNISDVLDD